MIPGEHRAKGGRELGATADGQPGPFGTRPADGDDQDDGAGLDRDELLLAAAAAAAEARAQEARERFAARRKAAAARREALWRARQHGVAQRHAHKLNNRGQDDRDDTA